MKDSPGKSKPTLESVLNDLQVVTGKYLIKQQKEADRQKAIEFKGRSRSRYN